ncbi:MAG: DegV family protein [Carnobacterium sp.]|uniref:DegV family protein n=1 Tax=unclassified Carnobacterium TaxID=257487 RepID=UPI001914A361|nr:DegV family protein [Carnobacterium sp. CS13]QQP70333.1 DegV family EDD domain-containing protein [Carnobacterium sp. CS13]
MKKIVFSTESGADLPIDLIQQHAIQVVPMHVVMDGKDYLDDGSTPVTDIYDFYERTKTIPTTTSTNPNEYHEFFTKIEKAYPDCIIVHIGYTSKASSSFQNARIVSEDFADLYLIDALNVSGGLTAIVMYAVDLLEKQPNIELDQLLTHIRASVFKARLAFVPGSLEFLRAGGRVSNMAYLGASLLKLKPLIELIDGKLMSTKKYRGKMSRVAEELLHDYLNRYDIDKEQLYFLYSLGLEKSIQHRMSELAAEKGFKNIKWIQTGSVISTHGGPGAFGVAGLEK